LIKERTTRPYGSVRKELLATAIELFANRGYADVALRDIATKTKVHLPAIYKAFKNKRALYVECCSQVFERGTREIAAEIRPELSDEANVLAYAAQLTRVYINEPVVAKLAQRCVLDHDHELIDIIMKQAGSAYHGRIIEILERIVGARAKRCFFAISALSYGAIQLSAFRLPGESVPDPDSVEDISLFALESLLPQINWQEVKNLNDNSRARCDQTGSV